MDARHLSRIPIEAIYWNPELWLRADAGGLRPALNDLLKVCQMSRSCRCAGDVSSAARTWVYSR